MNKQRILQALENVKSNPYGKWGILNIEQRRFIKELCDSWLILDDATNKQMEEIERLNNIINELKEYIHNELILDFYNDNMPCELVINKMENMIKKLKAGDKE